jgi:hypothetical protein
MVGKAGPLCVNAGRQGVRARGPRAGQYMPLVTIFAHARARTHTSATTSALDTMAAPSSRTTLRSPITQTAHARHVHTHTRTHTHTHTHTRARARDCETAHAHVRVCATPRKTRSATPHARSRAPHQYSCALHLARTKNPPPRYQRARASAQGAASRHPRPIQLNSRAPRAAPPLLAARPRTPPRPSAPRVRASGRLRHPPAAPSRARAAPR